MSMAPLTKEIRGRPGAQLSREATSSCSSHEVMASRVRPVCWWACFYPASWTPRGGTWFVFILSPSTQQAQSLFVK